MVLSRVSSAFVTANVSFIAYSINLGFTGLSKIINGAPASWERKINDPCFWSSQPVSLKSRTKQTCCGPHCDIVQGKDCHESSIAMGQNVLLFRHLGINNFNCSVDFRAFWRYTTITKNIIVFPYYWTICKNHAIEMPHTEQILFPFTVLPFLRAHLLFNYPTSTCMSTITNCHFMILRCFFATKGSQIKQKYRHVCARGGALFIQKPTYW